MHWRHVRDHSRFFFELVLAGYGVAGIIAENRTMYVCLKIIGSAWMLWLAFDLRTLDAEVDLSKKIKIGFPRAFVQQFMNPKAWVMAVSGAGAFLPHLGSIHLDVFVYAASFGIIGFPSIITWLKAGDLIARMLTSARARTVTGYTLFALMLLSIATIWI
jgi:threonine/homoserine/homoserine lactone efflux protein